MSGGHGKQFYGFWTLQIAVDKETFENSAPRYVASCSFDEYGEVWAEGSTAKEARCNLLKKMMELWEAGT